MGVVPLAFIAICCISSISLHAATIDRTCKDILYDGSLGSNDSVRFSFDRRYPCGQYANGDWWISADAVGPVRIVEISPEAWDGLNGFEINPSSGSKQAFDRRVAGYTPSQQPALPLVIKSDASVVKAVSASISKQTCLPCLQYAAVLTVLNRPAVNSEKLFRPGYFGKQKYALSVEAIKLNKLPRLPVACCSASKELGFDELARRYRGVQLDHLEGWVGRSLHPVGNMPDYGASIARDTATGLLRMFLDDFSLGNPSHRSALVGYLQMSIDLLTMAENGVQWHTDGGHGNGRKLPLIVGGYLLEDDRFLKAVRKSAFSEDEQVFFSAVANIALYGRQCDDAQYWMQQRANKGPKDCRDPYGYIDGGGKEIGEGYQACCTAMPWKYTALAIRLLRLEESWSNEAFLQYVDRWVGHGAWAVPDPCAGFNEKVDEYGKKYGPKSSGRCIEGGGRFSSKHGTNKNNGYYGSKFGDQFWHWYVSRAPAPSGIP
jgi:hypothetical protein